MDVKLPYRIFAIDPAAGKSGWAVLDLISTNPLKIKIVEYGGLNGEHLLRQKHNQITLFKKQYCLIDAFEEEYSRLFSEWKPDIVVCESAFGFAHMQTLISLTLTIHSIRKASVVTLGKDIIEVPPTVSKMGFTGSGSADKDQMRKAYETVSFLIRTGPKYKTMFVKEIDPLNPKKKISKEIQVEDVISEHAIDAIAHGCCHVRRDITEEIIQVSAAEKKKEKRERQKLKEQKKKEKGGGV